MNARERMAYNIGVLAASTIVAGVGQTLGRADSFRRREWGSVLEELARELDGLTVAVEGEPQNAEPAS